MAKNQKMALKMLKQNAAQVIGPNMVALMQQTKDAGYSKKEAKNLAETLLKSAFKKISKNPEKYAHHHGGH